MTNNFPAVLDSFIKNHGELKRSISQLSDSESFELEEVFLNNLEELIKLKVYHLKAFEILLNSAPERAISYLKNYCLSADLIDSCNDHVADLAFMFSDIKEILGEDKLNEVLNCSEFTDCNKNFYRVKHAIEFAMGNSE
ncbi:hypothetical protein [Xenorhabdus bovienii]|uniref:hypothetical protein n=1 Tax=Xenorhabdus bovienii TaxID=40576 RepID=UPI0023B33460|nr:hypothetical protein [Xenorhabdus bovienii]